MSRRGEDFKRRRPFLRNEEIIKMVRFDRRERQIQPTVFCILKFTSGQISCTIHSMKDKIKDDKVYLYGKHALREALIACPQCVTKVFLDSNASADLEISELLKSTKIVPSAMKAAEAGKKVGEDAVHQGVIAVINTEKIYASFDVVLNILKSKNNPCIVLLDELQDPHNVGAIIRSAAAFGASAILMPEHNQAPITGTVIKTSAGMAFRIPIVRVGNVNQSIRTLKENGVWVYGLVMEGTESLTKSVFDAPTLFIIGNESTGIREKTLELCDVTLSIPMEPNCESLNASVAASVVMYEWNRQIKK